MSSACADEIQQVSDSLFYWSVYDPEIKTEMGSTAVKVPNGLVVVDPVPLVEEAWEELLEGSPLRAILLTSANHVRDADVLRRKHKVPIVTALAAHKEVAHIKPDVILLETELLYGTAAIPIPGATEGETAFLFKNGTLVIGDAIINLDSEKGIEFLPAKYCKDARQNRTSLARLLDLDFHTLTFAHGLPITQKAREKLSALLHS